jgi:chromosome segregation ATPase
MLGRIALTLTCVGLAGSVTPVQKAVQMLEGMLVKAKAAKHEENVQFAGFSEFCKNTQASKAVDIKEAESQMDLLNADIEKANSEVKRLKKEIGGHENDRTGWANDKADSTAVRDTERGTYLETHRDYQESIEALSQAMMMLKQQNYDRSAKSLLQKVSAFGKTPEEARNTIQAFVQDQEPDGSLPTATAYKFQSGSIITMLEKLKAEFKAELTELEKTEVARRQTFDMLQQDLADQTKDAENAIQEKTMTQAKQKQASIEKSGDLKEVTGVKDADSKYLSDLTQLCDQKTTEFEARTKLRDGEIEALDKAVEILSSDDVSGSADKHLPGLLQVGSNSFAHLRAATMNPNQRRVVEFLRTESLRLDSHALSALAMEAAADPFFKVKQLIQELIDRLITEAGNEATHKGWCDKELGTNKHTRETKSAEVDTLTSTIDGLDSDIKSLAKDITKKSGEVSKLEAAVAEFTKKRTKEKAENAAAVKDAEEGQKAIANAIKVLQDFYSKAAKATSLAQVSITSEKQQPKVPEIFDEAYKGDQNAKGGVVGMLEVIQSDFARLEADTKSGEQAAQNEYDEFMSDSAQTKASLDVDLKHCTTEKLAKEGELTMAKENLDTAQKTLDMALKAYGELKEPCQVEGTRQSAGDRKARREDEIESLKKALELLSADNLPQ